MMSRKTGDQILSIWNEDQVYGLLDESYMDFIDLDDFEDSDYYDDYSYYKDHSSGEAEAVVMHTILEDYQNQFGTVEDPQEFFALLKELFHELN